MAEVPAADFAAGVMAARDGGRTLSTSQGMTQQQQRSASGLRQRTGTLTNMATRTASNLATLNQVTGGGTGRKTTANALAPYGQGIKQITQSRLDEKKGETRRYFGFMSQRAAAGKKSKQEELKGELLMDDHYIKLEELYVRLETNPTTGLTVERATAFIRRDGLNKLTPPRKVPEWIKFLKTQLTMLSLLLWIAAILCFISYGLSPDPQNLSLGIALICVVLITGLFSYVQERKSSNLMESFAQMLPTNTTVIRDGNSSKIDATNLVKGDIIELRAGDKVPADIRLIECSDDLTVDNSGLTGESDPIKRDVVCSSENALETKNLAFFGTFIPSGSGRGVVINTGDRTVMGRIASLTLQTDTTVSPIAKEIGHFVFLISCFAIVCGVVFFVIGIGLGTDWLTNFVFMIGIIVANVPEGLPVSMTVCLSRAAQNMAAKNVLVKNLESVETLGSASCICSDKTGTLTQNIMTIANIVFDLKIWDVNTTMSKENFNDKDPSFLALLRSGVLCSTAVWDIRSQFVCDRETGELVENAAPIPFIQTINHPDGSMEDKVMWVPIGDASEAGMIKFCQTKTDVIRFREEYPLNQHGRIPFNSTNKYQAQVVWNPHQKHWMVTMKGAPERIALRCGTIMENGVEIPMTEDHRSQIAYLMLTLSRKGMRVLAFAEKKLALSDYPESYRFEVETLNFPIGEPVENFEESLKRFNESGTGKGGGPSPRQMETLCYLGMMALIDPPRPQVFGAVQKCKSAGIKVIMVTGDHPETAKAIAKKVGIIWNETADDLKLYNSDNGLQQGMPGWRDPDMAHAIVIPGWDISVNTPTEVWDDILEHSQIVFARTSPQQKLLIVENCQKRGHVVAVTGDGVNDSPALKQADIGIAMGIMGTEVSKEAANMILLDDNFASIVSGVEDGRLIFDNLKKTIAYALAVNIPELIPFLVFILAQVPLALTTVVILLICLGTDMLPAISLAWEAPESDIMSRAPRNSKTDKLVSWKLIVFAYGMVGCVQSFAGFFAFFTVLDSYGYMYNVLAGLGAVDAWGKQALTCQVKYGAWRNVVGDYCPCFEQALASNVSMALCGNAANAKWWDTDDARNVVITQCQKLGYIFFDQDSTLLYTNDAGILVSEPPASIPSCVFPVNQLKGGLSSPPESMNPLNGATYHAPNGELFTGSRILPTMQSLAAVRGGPECMLPSPASDGCLFYYEFLAYRGIRNPSFETQWLAWDTTNSAVPGLGKLDPGIMLEYQPIGQWNVSETSLTASTTNMGFVTNVVSLSTALSNPDRIGTHVYNNGILDQSNNFPWLTTNTVPNSEFDAMLQANAQTFGLICSTCVISDYYTEQWYIDAIGHLQYARCGNIAKTMTVSQVSAQAIAQGSFTCYPEQSSTLLLLNVANRQMQAESLAFAQTAFFIAIVFTQWSNAMICKTRYLSIYDQTLDNTVMNFSLLFEISLAVLVCYASPIAQAIGTRPLESPYWFCAMPFSCLIFTLDELRRYFLRRTSHNRFNPHTERVERIPGWFERNTYY